MQQKVEKKVFSGDNCIWSACRKFSLSQRKYLSLGVSLLTNIPKIEDIFKTDTFHFNFAQSHGKIIRFLDDCTWIGCGKSPD